MLTPLSNTLETEAGNENTSPERLVELAGISPELALQVAQNPSAPPELLKQLCHRSLSSNLQSLPRKIGPEFLKQLCHRSRSPNPKSLPREIVPGFVMNIFLILLKLMQRVAQNPSAPPELLQELSQHQDRLTRQNVTANPNTPIASLLKLAAEFPETFLENPILPLLPLEKPDFLLTLPIQTALRLLQCKQVPASWIRLVSVDVRLAVVRNESSPSAFLEKLAEDEDYRVREIVGKHRQTPIAVLEQLASDENYRVRLAVICNESIPSALLRTLFEKLAEDEDYRVREIVACHWRTGSDIRGQLATRDEDYRVRLSAAGNHQLSWPVLKQCAGDEDYRVRQAVVTDPCTPIAFLEQLARDEDYRVRLAVVQCRKTPIAVLEKLGGDENPEVRQAVARHPHTPKTALILLAEDDDDDVRAAARTAIENQRNKLT